MSIGPNAVLRVVLDSNIYIAALISPRGPNSQLWRAATESRYLLLISPAIIAEIAAVLRTRFGWPEPLIQNRIKRLAKTAEVVLPETTVNLILADPPDNRVLECAIDGKADLIVSNDHHLLDLKLCQGVPIMAGPDFRRTLGIPAKC